MEWVVTPESAQGMRTTGGATGGNFVYGRLRMVLVARLSCIIPCTGNTEALERTLVSVLERRPDECEVLVVLTAPYDDPYKLEGEIQFVQAPAEAGLIGCLNLGIAAAKAPVVHLLASGLEVDTGWIERALAHFEDPRVAAVAPAIFDIADRGRLITAESNSPVVPLLEAAFYRKAVLEAAGGLPSGLGSRADVDFARALAEAGWQIVADRNCRVFAPASDVTIQIPQTVALGLLGRMAAIFGFGTAGRYQKFVQLLKAELDAASQQKTAEPAVVAAAASEGKAQHRIDAAHAQGSAQGVATEPAMRKVARSSRRQKGRR